MEVLQEDITPFSQAIIQGDIDAVSHLITSSQVDVNSSDRVYDECSGVFRTEPALVTASKLGHEEIVGLLIKNGAHLNASDMSLGKSALHWACSKKHVQIGLDLIDAGANVNVSDYLNETPIVEAIAIGNMVLFNKILSNGLRLDTRLNLDQETALMFCLGCRKYRMAYVLIQAGADIYSSNNYGQDAFRLTSDMIDFIQLLVDADGVHTRHYSEARELGIDVSTPASLKSLCRRTVRQSVKQMDNTTILPALEKLPLPQLLLQYLCLDNYIFKDF